MNWFFVFDAYLAVAGIPPRQAGHFFLVAQKEVTKKEGLKNKRSFVPPSFKLGGTIVNEYLASLIPRTVGHQIGSEHALAYEPGGRLSLLAGRVAPIHAERFEVQIDDSDSGRCGSNSAAFKIKHTTTRMGAKRPASSEANRTLSYARAPYMPIW